MNLAFDLERRAREAPSRTGLLSADGRSWSYAAIDQQASRIANTLETLDVRPGDVELLLCHNPDGAPGLARPGCAAILSGHTHGHQINLPLVRRAAPPHPGDRVERGATACITSTGVGAIGVPIRLRAPAEVVLLELGREA